MINILNFYEAGKARSGVAYFPFASTDFTFLYFSTKYGNAVITWLDATTVTNHNTRSFDYVDNEGDGVYKTYSPPLSGNVSVLFKNGLRDMYSFDLRGGNTFFNKTTVWNIQNWGEFINQFPNLHNFKIQIQGGAVSTFKGSLFQMPDSVEKIWIDFFQRDSWQDFVINFNDLQPTSKLKYYHHVLRYNQFDSSTIPTKTIGDIARIPSGCTYFNIDGSGVSGNYEGATNSYITYTAGKFWASSFDTLSIPLALTTPELDNLLIDMNNSITTKIGEGVIAVGGYRSPISDIAVASLVAKGFTVNVSRHSIFQRVLDLPFQNSFLDSGEIGITMVAGGTSNQPTFALSGRKAGEYCAVFNGSQSIKTTTNLPVNSDKVTVAFWMKTTQTGVAIVGEMSPNTNSNNTFSWYINDNVANSIQFNSRNTGENKSARTGANNGTWKHFVAVIDRAQNGANEILIYENGALVTFTKPDSTDSNGNFVNNILFIGQRAGSSLGFNGSLTKLKIYNYPLTAGEVSTLYNSEL